VISFVQRCYSFRDLPGALYRRKPLQHTAGVQKARTVSVAMVLSSPCCDGTRSFFLMKRCNSLLRFVNGETRNFRGVLHHIPQASRGDVVGFVERCRIALKPFQRRIINIECIGRENAQATIRGLEDPLDGVAAEGGGVARILLKHFWRIAIKTIQAAGGADPEKTLAVLVNAHYFVVRQPGVYTRCAILYVPGWSAAMPAPAIQIARLSMILLFMVVESASICNLQRIKSKN